LRSLPVPAIEVQGESERRVGLAQAVVQCQGLGGSRAGLPERRHCPGAGTLIVHFRSLPVFFAASEQAFNASTFAPARSTASMGARCAIAGGGIAPGKAQVAP